MLLKRSLVAVIAAATFCGCGAHGAAVVESPAMVLAAAVKATDSLSSYTIKFAATESFPLSGKSLGLSGSSGGSSAISGTFNGNFTGDLKVVKPDRLAFDATAKLNGISIEFSAIRIGADSYSKDLLSGAWKKSTAGSGANVLGNGLTGGASLDSLDPATMTDLLKYLSVDQTFADTDVDGAHVHHYRVKLDTAKLKDELSHKGVLADGKSNQFFDDIVKQSQYTIEVWVGTADHLVRRVSFSLDSTMDLGGLGGFNLGGASPKPASTPQPVHVTAHAQLDYADFNKSIQVTPPPIG
ncbi:MAG TPA: hypothetical protein VNV65_00215 [Candidatus Solibacter sp.]|jgi:hypothetical protein|nr:hypothetical protein [Candidatus Solibacter sp.]